MVPVDKEDNHNLRLLINLNASTGTGSAAFVGFSEMEFVLKCCHVKSNVSQL